MLSSSTFRLRLIFVCFVFFRKGRRANTTFRSRVERESSFCLFDCLSFRPGWGNTEARHLVPMGEAKEKRMILKIVLDFPDLDSVQGYIG